MLRSGITFGIIAFVLTLIASNAVCSVCFAIFLGLAAGYTAARSERPLDSGDSTRLGAGAGALAGGLMIPAQLISAAIQASGGQLPGGSVTYELIGPVAANTVLIWISQLLIGGCMGIITLAIMAGAGAGGSTLWFQRRPKPDLNEPIPPAL